MISSYKRINNSTGWAVFAVAAVVYGLTIEPTASFWDCGEYIACSMGLEVGHPPGAPLFLLIARCFGMMAAPANAAMMINFMSGLCSAFTILFLFWSITQLAKKVLLKTAADYTKERVLSVMAAGAIGALAFTFTDSFWFSAVEGEVYAMSSLFTAWVFWAMLRWEEAADEPYADRWLILIAYLIGLSIGVHLLNLLTIPALVFIWYFRKNKKVTRKGLLITSVVALLLLGGIQNGVIPGVVMLAAKIELLFVNTLGLPFDSGTVTYFVLLIGGLAAGIWYTHKKRKAAWNTALLCFAVILVGYSSFFVLVIRSQAHTPINENNPSNAISMLSYLNREQYGDWPLLYGPYYNTPVDPEEPYTDGDPLYVRDEKSGTYIVTDERKGKHTNYDSRYCTVFPRMYSPGHAGGYKNFADIEGRPVEIQARNGMPDTIMLPTFGENLRFFLRYQVGFMYLRYFGWNFVGRQNDRLSYGSELNGWTITGTPLDRMFLHDHQQLPKSLRENKGYNRYFALPFILGLLGIFWHVKRSRRDALVVLLLFLFTGLSIIVYLNQTPYQPRERDYAYVGSFYAFAIWIGLGVLWLRDKLSNFLKGLQPVIVATVLSSSVPLILAVQNWDDHDRSGRTAARDLAYNMLQSCAPNAILFTYADNDTFPLWYLQEVEGVRRDVRVICLSLFSSDWHVAQMQRKQYDSDPLPFTLNFEQYREGTRDFIFIEEETPGPLHVKDAVAHILNENKKIQDIFGGEQAYVPSRRMMLPVDKAAVLKSGMIPKEREALVADTMQWSLRGGYIFKDQMMILDLMAHNDWKRPVYFAAGMPVSAYAGLNDYLQLEGLAYRVVPIDKKKVVTRPELPMVHTERMYDNVKKHFQYGNAAMPGIYLDENIERFFTEPMREAMSNLAMALSEEGKHQKAADVAKLCAENIPPENAPANEDVYNLLDPLYKAKALPDAEKLSRKVFEEFEEQLRFIRSFSSMETNDTQRWGYILQQLQLMAKENGQTALAQEYAQRMSKLRVPEYTPPPALPDSLMKVKDSVKKDSVKK